MNTPFKAAPPGQPTTETFRYGTALVAVHWLMALLMVGVFATIELRVFYEKGTEMRDFMKTLHFMLGLSVLVMVALYGFMLLMPLAGWLTLSAAGKPIAFFGLELPALVDPNKALATNVKELHETVGQLGYWLIGIHVAAALGHHHLLKDGLMSRMALCKAAV